MALTWKEEFEKELIAIHGNKKGKELAKQYTDIFPHSYKDQYSPKIATSDLNILQALSDRNPLALSLYYDEQADESVLHLRLFQWQKPIPLSDILPMLENLNLRTDTEQPFKLHINQEHDAWIGDFTLLYAGAKLDLKTVKPLFEEAFIKIYFGTVEDDGLNKLILGAFLSWREISLLRTYVKYLRQIGFRFTQPYIEKTLLDNPTITHHLVELFLLRHDPRHQKKNTDNQGIKIENEIIKSLEMVTSLDEDRIVRRILSLIKATLRTNYFLEKEYISIKLDSRNIPDLPLPAPLYEIFVYSSRFEGIHLRNTKVARGGIRWSDRLEDFRTEILGLMKAQVVKNAIIVPSGAKGGFVLKAVKTKTTREMLQSEVIYCYKEFIRGLLDITSNIVGGKEVNPKNVVCYDDYDSYLVVAADKGTATFSDIANDISKEYNFWLADAFASGGSTGYDHKEMGITARGAWESIKRHFRELSINPMKDDITVIGIGDMSGDVFGNGMLYSKHIRLVAAFDHRHIFLDPTPDAEKSYQERKRLFALPISNWGDYNTKLISKGGGVYSRSEKSIPISPQLKKALAIEDNALAPMDLIKAILKAPVDLLYNGGIGTYVKAQSESNADVGDRSNDYCRVDGADLRCKVVGEGGNLGFTQLGRVEYALKGGLINTDFIDNSGGVDCSDHEVNLKILLEIDVSRGKLSQKKRNDLLASVTDEVAKLVLKDNDEQALVMSFSAFHSGQNLALHMDYIRELASLGALNREVEFLPSDRTLLERKSSGLGLTRPELAILLAYTKIHIKHALLNSTLPEDPYLSKLVASAFPPALTKKYKKEMHEHRLHRDIIATQLSNTVVNEMGITFVYRLQTETGATIDEIIRAHAVASNIFGTKEVKKLVESLDYKIPISEQYSMLYQIRNLINLATRWFLHSPLIKQDLEPLIDHFSKQIRYLEPVTPKLMGGAIKGYLEKLITDFVHIGLSRDMAKRIATYRAIYTSLNIIDVATQHNYDLMETAEVYYAAGERASLLWFRDQINADTREGHWNALARLTLRDELDIAQRALAIAIINSNKKEHDPHMLIDHWMKINARAIERWDRMLTKVHGSDNLDYTMFFIAIRELVGLIRASYV